jgi:hypothetical protein
MYRCEITKRVVPPGIPATKIPVEIRKVIYKIVWAGGEMERMITQSEGWEIVREVLVSPKEVSKLPTIEQLMEGLKKQVPVERIQYLKSRPKWRRPGDRPARPGSNFKPRLKLVTND